MSHPFHCVFFDALRRNGTLSSSQTATHPTQNHNSYFSCECSHFFFLHNFIPYSHWGMKLPMSHCLSVCFPIPLLRWGSPPPWEPVGSFNPPVRQYQTDVSIKEEPIYKSQLVCWIGGSLSKEDIREEGPGQEPPILQEAVSLRACPSTARHKRAFLSSTSLHHCPALLPLPPLLEYLSSRMHRSSDCSGY